MTLFLEEAGLDDGGAPDESMISTVKQSDSIFVRIRDHAAGRGLSGLNAVRPCQLAVRLPYIRRANGAKISVSAIAQMIVLSTG